MRSRAQDSNQSVGNRHGISVVEFVGCLAALGGGIVLGSMYLGVDVRAMAVGILEKADIDVPAVLDAQAPTTEVAQANEPQTAEEPQPSTAEATDEASYELEEEYSQDQVAPTDVPAEEEPARQELTEAESWAATKTCWATLNQVVKEEAANRNKAIRDPSNWQLFDYLLHRKQGHENVVEVLEQLDRFGIDPRLASHLHQVLTWHKAGAKLYDRATLLLTDAPAGRLSGPFAQSWQSAATQHRMEEKLILNKHASVASYLEHKLKASETAESEQ